MALLSTSGLDDWGVAYGQTAPGRHGGAQVNESTPGPPGSGSAPANTDQTQMSTGSTVGVTSVVGLILIAAGIALILAGIGRKYRARSDGPPGLSNNDSPPVPGPVADD